MNTVIRNGVLVGGLPVFTAECQPRLGAWFPNTVIASLRQLMYVRMLAKPVTVVDFGPNNFAVEIRASKDESVFTKDWQQLQGRIEEL